MEVDTRERDEIFQDATQFVRQNTNSFNANALLFLYARFKQVRKI